MNLKELENHIIKPMSGISVGTIYVQTFRDCSLIFGSLDLFRFSYLQIEMDRNQILKHWSKIEWAWPHKSNKNSNYFWRIHVNKSKQGINHKQMWNLWLFISKSWVELLPARMFVSVVALGHPTRHEKQTDNKNARYCHLDWCAVCLITFGSMALRIMRS